MSCEAATQNPILAKLARLAVQLFYRNTRELVRMLIDGTFRRWRRRREGGGMCPPSVPFPHVTSFTPSGEQRSSAAMIYSGIDLCLFVGNAVFEELLAGPTLPNPNQNEGRQGRLSPFGPGEQSLNRRD